MKEKQWEKRVVDKKDKRTQKGEKCCKNKRGKVTVEGRDKITE